MEETIEVPLTDTYHSIGKIIDNLRHFESPYCDPRIKSIVLTKLEEAQLRSLQLIVIEDVPRLGNLK